MSDFRAEGYFVITPEWVLDADISDKAVRLYGVLRSYADHRTGIAFPSRRTLAARLHVADPKAVDRAMAELEAIGAVVVERSPLAAPGQPRTSNRYLLRHTPGGADATPPAPALDQTPSSDGRGVNAPGGVNAPRVGAEIPLPWGHEDPQGRGASAPLTRSKELDPKNQNTPAAAGAGEGMFPPDGYEQPAPTINQRAKVITDEHYEACGRMEKWAAVRGVVVTAIKAGHDDEAIRKALADLRGSGMSVATATLRNALARPGSGGRGQLRSSSGRRQWEPRERGTYTEAGDGTF